MRIIPLLHGLLVAIAFTSGSLFAQGSLTPPGAPAPTGKTLSQIEARGDVQKLAGDATALYVIGTPGSYYLTANIIGVSGKAAIAIAGNDITLDLNGFQLIGVAGATRGIEIRGVQNVTVRGGGIRNWTEGVSTTSTSEEIHLEDLTISRTTGAAISLNASASHTVRRCTIRTVTGSGIDLNATGLVQDCTVEGLTTTNGSTLYGINADEVVNSVVTNVINNGGPVIGINGNLTTRCRVSDLLGAGTSSGIVGLTVTDCAVSNVAASISAAVGIEGSNVSNSTAQSIGGSNTITATGIRGSVTTGCSARSVVARLAASGIVGDLVTKSSAFTVTQTQSSGATDTTMGIDATHVSDCSVRAIHANSLARCIGINAAQTVSNCSAWDIVNPGAGNASGIAAGRVGECHVSFVNGSSSADTTGINAEQEVSNCSVNHIVNSQGASTSIACGPGGRVQNCSVLGAGSTKFGIRVTTGGQAIGNTVHGMSTNGINLINGSTAEGNNVAACTLFGILAASQSLVVRNHFYDCGQDLSADATCRVGALESTPGTINNTNPHLNFRDP